MSDALAMPPPPLPPDGQTGAADSDGLARFLNWTICWIILPNLPFLPIMLAGGPMRATEIAFGAIFGLIAGHLRYGLRLAAFVLLLLYMVLTFIAAMFNMHISMILSVIGLVLDIRPAASPEYLVGAGLVALSLGLAARRLRRPGDLREVKWVIAAAALTVALSSADYVHAADTATAYNRLIPDDAPFSSATVQTDFAKLADGKAHVMVVIVEAMGLPTDPRLRARLDAIWTRPELARRFDISQGRTAFYNSTTKGEIRELCQRWGDYPEIDAPQPDCLPAKLAAQGYGTHAFHGFSSQFFDRKSWYPRIGFQQLHFRDAIEAQGAGHCPNVFPGACDRDIPRLIGRELTAAQGPQFVYWLTLNSHLPVVANAALRTENCRQLGTALDSDYPQVCRLFSLWDDVAEGIARMADRADFPPTHILIVGDHMPPFTQQSSRMMFDPAHVPWILLRYRPSEPRPAA